MGLDGRLGGGLECWRGTPKGPQTGLQTGYGRGLVLNLRSGPGQVWYSIQLKFNSLKLDSEVGRLV